MRKNCDLNLFLTVNMGKIQLFERHPNYEHRKTDFLPFLHISEGIWSQKCNLKRGYCPKAFDIIKSPKNGLFSISFRIYTI